MGANNGSGWPMFFRCSLCRRENRITGGFTLTGKTRPYKGGNKGVRGSMTFYQYRCRVCEHVGWSRHKDLEHRAEHERLILEATRR